MLSAFFETDIHEAIGWFSSFGFIVIIITAIVPILLYIITKKNINNNIFSCTISLYLFLSPCIIGFIEYKNQSELTFNKYTIQSICDCYPDELLFNNLKLFISYISHDIIINDLLKIEKNLPKDCILLENNIDKIVILLGESDSKYHHSIYGYSVNTDPFISNLNKSFIKSYNAISPAQSTRESIIRMLSFADAVNINQFYTYKNIIDMANLAKFNTYWFSTQNKVGLNDTLVSSISIYSKCIKFYYNTDDNSILHEFYKKYNKYKKELFFIHINGSHIRYKDRYNIEDYNTVKESDRKYIDYDASIAHTDKLIKDIVSFIDDKSLFIYIPDHGEIVNIGHGFSNIDKTVYDIPFFIICKNNKILHYADNIIKSYMNNNIFNSSCLSMIIGEFIGYKIPQYLKYTAINNSKYVLGVDGKSYIYNKIN